MSDEAKKLELDAAYNQGVEDGRAESTEKALADLLANYEARLRVERRLAYLKGREDELDGKPLEPDYEPINSLLA